MVDFMVILVIGVILGAAMTYIVKKKKAGARCIGCSLAGACSTKCEDGTNPLVQKYKQEKAV